MSTLDCITILGRYAGGLSQIRYLVTRIKQPRDQSPVSLRSYPRGTLAMGKERRQKSDGKLFK